MDKIIRPNGRVDVVLDTDAYNEIDDQYAISLIMKMPEKFNVKALYAAPFYNGNSTSPKDGMEKSYYEILNLLNLMGLDFQFVYKGSTDYLIDERTPIVSPASENLVALAKNYSPENPLYVMAIGAITNVASAFIMAPEIAKNTVVVWLGGHAIHWNDTKEFNMFQDVAAARVVYDSDCQLVQLPCGGVVDKILTTKPELEYWLKGKNDLCDYLLSHSIDQAEHFNKLKTWSRVIWDVTAPMWFLGQDLMSYKVIARPIPEYDYTYSFSEDRKPLNYVVNIDRDKVFNILFSVLTER